MTTVSSTLVMAVFLSVTVFTTFAGSRASALTLNGGEDCSANSVINCGATSTAELISKYNNTGSYPGVHAIYNYFGITSTDVASLNNTAVAGTVDKNGNVYVNNKLVARGAVTAGRENIDGSTKITYQGMTFYKRIPSVSFVVSSIDAFVVMNNGVFQFAILSPCGNPIIATPVVQPTYSCTNLTLNVASSDPDTVVADVTHASANGAIFKNVTYSIKNDTTGAITSMTGSDTNVKYTFSSYGEQTIAATVNFTLDGKVVSATSNDCSKSITIAQPSTPTYACILLTVSSDPSTPNSIIATSTYSQSGGAQFSKAVYDFGDNSTATVNSPTNLTINHTYTDTGTYLVSVTYTFLVNGSSKSVSSLNCEKSVTFTPATVVMCTLPGLTQYPANSPNCATVVPPTSTLVNTGPGTVGTFLIILGSVSVLAGTGYYTVIKHKNKDIFNKDLLKDLINK